jgi:hypothetical protein
MDSQLITGSITALATTSTLSGLRSPSSVRHKTEGSLISNPGAFFGFPWGPLDADEYGSYVPHAPPGPSSHLGTFGPLSLSKYYLQLSAIIICSFLWAANSLRRAIFSWSRYADRDLHSAALLYLPARDILV